MKRNLRINYKRRKRASMFFLLWAAFALLALLILLVFSVTQRLVMKDTYEKEAIDALSEKGSRINREIRDVEPEQFGMTYDGFIRYLRLREGVSVYLLSGDGQILLPSGENPAPNMPELDVDLDFSERIEEHKSQLAEAGATHENRKAVIYAAEGGYVFGATLPPYGDSDGDTYLYIHQSVEFVQSVEGALNARMIWIALFVFILSFAVSSALAGVLTRPIDDISAKAKQLATGDFDVDFEGDGYFEEMESLAKSLNFARDELSKADKMQKELIANVSHDFKTPLTMIKAYAEMIVEFAGEDKEKRDQSAQVIIDEADRLASLVSDVLDLSKIRSGIQELKIELFDVSAYLREILGRFDYLAQTQGYHFETDIDKGLYTAADRLKIGQVLYNLIGNAANYTGENKKVWVTLKKQGNVIRFAVQDTGKGIKEEELNTIWDRYYRSSETHKRPVRGTGLGLSIVKTILEKHAFVFGVDSIVGVGSTFYVLFPLKGEETDEDE